MFKELKRNAFNISPLFCLFVWAIPVSTEFVTRFIRNMSDGFSPITGDVHVSEHLNLLEEFMPQFYFLTQLSENKMKDTGAGV